ncbi:hypothetical protein [Methyloraptor flagellatus]|jgi:predicted transcriptional regulator|uniref:CopG family transcriptional regulator n=1 Tax=Methyloraptor flagellatus TaxID=3162530 RepID=A0AAU7XBV9_9HYPH
MPLAPRHRNDDRYRDELDEALRSIESGVGHSSEQVFDWLRSWGTADEKPSPQPDLGPKR